MGANACALYRDTNLLTLSCAMRHEWHSVVGWWLILGRGSIAQRMEDGRA